MKSFAKILLFFVLTTSIASAWDTDNCGTDLVFDTASAVSGHAHGSSQSKAKDLCGHCGHIGMHLLGQIAGNGFLSPDDTALRYNEVTAVKPPATLRILFRPPRHSSLV